MSEEILAKESEEATRRKLSEKRKAATEQDSSDGEEEEDEVEEGTLPPALQKAIDAKKKKGGKDEEEVDEENGDDDDEEEVDEENGDEEDEDEVEESQDFERDKKAKFKTAEKGEKSIPSDKTKLESAIPKTKNGMLKSVYEIANKLKKDQLTAKYEEIMKSFAILEDAEDGEEDEDEKVESKRTKAAVKAEDLNIDVKEDVEALIQGEDGLTEEFKQKASTIFEAAVQAKVLEEVNAKLVELEAQHETEHEANSDNFQKELTEKVDGYLTYVVEEWMSENELAIERGIRSELVEDFMSGLKTLFSEHYIDIPEEKVDMVDDLFTKVDDLETSLDEEINRGVELQKELAQFKKDDVLKHATKDLADTETEKISKLAEGIEYENAKQYAEKISVLKESYFPKSDAVTSEITETDENIEVSEEESAVKLDENMKHYTSAITRFHN